MSPFVLKYRLGSSVLRSIKWVKNYWASINGLQQLNPFAANQQILSNSSRASEFTSLQSPQLYLTNYSHLGLLMERLCCKHRRCHRLALLSHRF